MIHGWTQCRFQAWNVQRVKVIKLMLRTRTQRWRLLNHRNVWLLLGKNKRNYKTRQTNQVCTITTLLKVSASSCCSISWSMTKQNLHECCNTHKLVYLFVKRAHFSYTLRSKLYHILISSPVSHLLFMSSSNVQGEQPGLLLIDRLIRSKQFDANHFPQLIKSMEELVQNYSEQTMQSILFKLIRLDNINTLSPKDNKNETGRNKTLSTKKLQMENKLINSNINVAKWLG